MKYDDKIAKGKRIFYENYGNHFSIAMNYGEKEYKRLKVPIALEKEWQNDIKNKYLQLIYSHKCAEQYKYVLIYIDLISPEQTVEFLEELLRYPMDSFTRLLYCELIKDAIKHIKLLSAKAHAQLVLEQNKEKLLSSDIIIDEKYKYDMQKFNYEWSKVPLRIQNL